jgi:chitobiase/beta-hexosaminidase-like protein
MANGIEKTISKFFQISAIALIGIVSTLYSHRSEAATATNLVTVCLSAKGTTQASKCTVWQYNVYSSSEYIETYPQVMPGPKVWTDPAYQYILGSTITPSMGVKVCPTALTVGVTYYAASADPCPGNKLVSASTVIPAATTATPAFSPSPGFYGPTVITSVGLIGPQAVTLTDSTPGASIHFTTDGSPATPSSPTYTGPIRLPASLGAGTVTTIHAIALAPGHPQSSAASGVYTAAKFPSDDFAQPIANLMTVCTSATATTQASKCTAWQYNFYSPTAFLESYPHVTPGPANWTDPTYQYVAGSAIAPTMGVKVCPTATLLPGTSFSNANDDPCANNVLTVASSVIPTPPTAGNPYFLYGNPGTEASDNSCAYYRGIGAEHTAASTGPCQINQADGSFSNGTTMSQWLATYYNPIRATAGAVEGSSRFLNINDLNFVRDHHAIESADGTAGAAYVCNYPGPDFYRTGPDYPEDQAAIDLALQNAADDIAKNVFPLPCVAFDYNVFSQAPGHTVFYDIRFLVFNQAGNLASAVDLDGRGPKQIPAACTACHGVPFGGVTPDSDHQPNGATYIPFDEQNIRFSTADHSSATPTGLSPAVEAQLKTLNQIVLTEATTMPKENGQTYLSAQSVPQLIHGWYDTSPGSNDLGSATWQNYLPPKLQPGTPYSAFDSSGNVVQLTVSEALKESYTELYAPYCRSCHVSNNVRNAHVVGPPPTDAASLLNDLRDNFNLFPINICNPAAQFKQGGTGGGAGAEPMPNSKVAFDRLWGTYLGVPHSGNLGSQVNLIGLLQSSDILGTSCVPPTF